MMFSSPLFCDTCGAANRSQAIFCASCGSRLHVAVRSSTGQTLTGRLAPHHLLNRRYRVIDQVGKGGFGAVYKAEDSAFGNRLVAVKEMSQSSLSPQELAEATRAFKQEALLLAGLTHPNLPRIYDQFSENGRWYLVMDFIEGETLESSLQKRSSSQAIQQPAFPIEQTLDIALQLCAVLDYLHTRQPPIIFRDLKPANIMLTANGHLALIDFGIARHFKPGQARDTTALGSIGYAAPEQYGKAQTTPQTDLYGLGATLHQMLSGDDPTQSPFHFAPLHLSGPPSLARLATLVTQMIAIEVNKRPASAALVRQQIEEIATDYRLAMRANSLSPGSGTHSVKPTGTGRGGALPPGYQPPAVRRRAVSPQPQPNTLFMCHGHRSRITALAWSPDGTRLASASYDKTVRLWDGASGKLLFIYRGHAGRVNTLAWSSDGRCIASGSDDCTVQVWEAASGNLLFTYRGHVTHVTALSWSPDRAYLASSDEGKTIHIWRIASVANPVATQSSHAARINALSWSPDGKHLASAGSDKKVQVWEPFKVQRGNFLMNLLTSSRSHFVYAGHRGRVTSLAWSPDSRRIVSGGADRTVQVWHVPTGARSFIYHTRSAGVNAVAWSPDGRAIAFGGNEKTVQVWNVLARQSLSTYLGHTNSVTSVAWSPDGRRVASAGVDHTVQVWKVS